MLLSVLFFYFVCCITFNTLDLREVLSEQRENFSLYSWLENANKFEFFMTASPSLNTGMCML